MCGCFGQKVKYLVETIAICLHFPVVSLSTKHPIRFLERATHMCPLGSWDDKFWTAEPLRNPWWIWTSLIKEQRIYLCLVIQSTPWRIEIKISISRELILAPSGPIRNYCTTGKTQLTPLYRVGLVVVDLGLVDTDFGYSTNCPNLLGQLEVWQNGLWEQGMMMEHGNLSQHNPGLQLLALPFSCPLARTYLTYACNL